MEIFDDVTQMIGGTPMVRLRRVVRAGMAEVCLKLESKNPGGSVKDRPALSMIDDAEARGVLQPGGLIIEPTSGNTGIGLAMVAAARGYRAIIVMPENASRERIALMQGFGADVVLSPTEQGMSGAVALATDLLAQNPDAFMPDQFANPANPEAHRRGTAMEIMRQTEGQVDAFVATAGTGGTITGIGQALKELLPAVRVFVVEPASSPVLSGGPPGRHRIPGMGPGFVPEVLDQTIYERIFQVTDEDALCMARRLMAEEGLMIGPSSGASVWASLEIATELGPGKRVVAIAPDTGERYISTELFAD
ncbi:MAG: cysteine synthase A [Thermaerobacter sp.]|nr:cysteine synthase A [Thermaerobacter sp.]